MKYKIIIETTVEKEYPETERVWLDKSGKKTNIYAEQDKYIDEPTGKKLLRIDKEEIFTQSVETIDLPAVIKAINNLK